MTDQDPSPKDPFEIEELRAFKAMFDEALERLNTALAAAEPSSRAVLSLPERFAVYGTGRGHIPPGTKPVVGHSKMAAITNANLRKAARQHGMPEEEIERRFPLDKDETASKTKKRKEKLPDNTILDLKFLGLE